MSVFNLKQLKQYLDVDVARGFSYCQGNDPDNDNALCDIGVFTRKDLENGKAFSRVWCMYYAHKAHKYDKKKCSCESMIQQVIPEYKLD